jgi:hypothetical protein
MRAMSAWYGAGVAKSMPAFHPDTPFEFRMVAAARPTDTSRDFAPST